MKTVLATTLIALCLSGIPAVSFATETDRGTGETSVVPDGDPSPPAATDPDHADGEGTAEDQAGPPDDILKNFTRHRPGACPEGPPCKVE